ncbi:MAG: hypothetical protein JXB23_12850 [Candidatus Aminicenantes bacterium]|nr:hypothetical protein [Candidatus Aminicenantes bacterium]
MIRNDMKLSVRMILGIVSLIILCSWGMAQTDTIGFDSDRWELLPGSKVVEHLGRQSLMGGAVLKDVLLEDGVIEVDISFTGDRCFPGFSFRRSDDANYEEFYIRPHKSGQPDALQYTPVFNGLSAWQLYSGEGFTNVWNFENEKWLHVKMEISGTQARVYLGESQKPALVVHYLKHDPVEGALSLKVTPQPSPAAYFSNFKFTRTDNLNFDPPPVLETPVGMMVDWEITQPLKYNLVDRRRYPTEQELGEIAWQKIKSEPSGLVNISRYARKSPALPDVVFARTAIISEKERLMELQFGYSDVASIFINGRPAFYGNSSFRLRDPFFQGLVGLFDSVYLPLEKGKNEILLMIAEQMGGWGFMCCDGEAVFQHEKLSKAWELPYRLSFPETVIYDNKRDLLYVSNYFSEGTQYVSKVTLNGEIENLEWITGLNRPTGMAIHKDRLYVVERASLLEIDIDAGEILKKYAAPSPAVNDIAFDQEGNAYISDPPNSRILIFKNGKISEWLRSAEIAGINGLHVYEGRLYGGSTDDGSLKSIGLTDKEIKTLASIKAGAIIDGLEDDGRGNLLVSDYNGRVFRITMNGEKTLLLDTQTPKHYCANFAFIPEKNLLVIPSLFDNRIMAFKLNRN